MPFFANLMVLTRFHVTLKKLGTVIFTPGRPTKVGNAVMAGIGYRQNHKTPYSHLVTGNTNSK